MVLPTPAVRLSSVVEGTLRRWHLPLAMQACRIREARVGSSAPRRTLALPSVMLGLPCELCLPPPPSFTCTSPKSIMVKKYPLGRYGPVRGVLMAESIPEDVIIRDEVRGLVD
jgi:hypothetical protein